jgi:hypothetical protein
MAARYPTRTARTHKRGVRQNNHSRLWHPSRPPGIADGTLPACRRMGIRPIPLLHQLGAIAPGVIALDGGMP